MTSRFTLDADLDLALRLADAAREISLARFRGSFQRRLKADGSIVTEVDEAVEDELRELLARERPADAILGEERGASGSGERRWIIDAIDGTLSFAAGKTGWGTLIALEVAGQRRRRCLRRSGSGPALLGRQRSRRIAHRGRV